jgi:hypothetical protein
VANHAFRAPVGAAQQRCRQRAVRPASAASCLSRSIVAAARKPSQMARRDAGSRWRAGIGLDDGFLEGT